MANEKSFSRLNGYKVKDSAAREEIEILKTAKADVTNVEELVNAVNTRVASAETSISELNTRFNYLVIPDSANEISFSGSGITATDVQNAVVEVNTKVTQNTSDIAELTSLINGIEIPEAVKEVVTGTTALTNGVSELANDTLYVEYETGETGTSVKNLYVGINGRAVKIATGSSSGGGTIVPNSIELTLYGGSGETVTLTKANETVATITLGSDGTTTYTLEGSADEEYTFTAGLSGRTATYTMGSGETNVKLRPDGFIYWYGVKKYGFNTLPAGAGCTNTYTEQVNSYKIYGKTALDNTGTNPTIKPSSLINITNFSSINVKCKNGNITYSNNNYSNDMQLVQVAYNDATKWGGSYVVSAYDNSTKVTSKYTSNVAEIVLSTRITDNTISISPALYLDVSGNGDAVTTASVDLVEWYFE